MAAIGLAMIVRNEAAVIRRCLDSVRPLIDFAIVSDTGSTDGTQQIVRDWLLANGVPGQLIERPWRDFASNRNDVLDALRRVGDIDYVLTIDADEILIRGENFDPEVFRRELPRADAWRVLSHAGPYRFRRTQLFSNRLPFAYRYPLHEKLVVPAGVRVEPAHGFHIECSREGARSRNPRKYLDDAALLERELAQLSDPADVARCTFYLAQSYRDAGEPAKALPAYLRRAGMGLDREECGLSLYYAAREMHRLGDPRAIATSLDAAAMLPERAEPLWLEARLCRIAGDYERGFAAARAGLSLPCPDALFVDTSIYEWRLLDEFQILAHRTGHLGDAVEAADRLLADQKIPETERERIETNALLSLQAFDALAAAEVAANDSVR